MAKDLTADDLLPLVVSLPTRERVRLLRLIAAQQSEASMYRSIPASSDEFSVDDDPLTWDAEGWEDLA